MACVSPTGSISAGPFTLSTFLSQWLPLILNVWIAYEMLEESEDAEEALEKIGKKSLDAAECLFDKYMELREKDCEVIEEANSQPFYKPRDLSRHAIQGARQATDFLKMAMGSTSRFDCGTRQQAIRAAQKSMILSSMQEQEQQWQQEFQMEDAYYEAHFDSRVSISLPNSTGALSQAFGSSSALWGVQLNSSNIQAAGALQSVSYLGGQALSGTGLFGGSSSPNFNGYGGATSVGGNSFF